MQIAGREDRPFRNLLGDVECGDHRHLEVAALHGGRLGALLEQRAVQMDLHVELARRALLEFLLEHRQHLGVPVGINRRRRDPELDRISGRGRGRPANGAIATVPMNRRRENEVDMALSSRFFVASGRSNPRLLASPHRAPAFRPLVNI